MLDLGGMRLWMVSRLRKAEVLQPRFVIGMRLHLGVVGRCSGVAVRGRCRSSRIGLRGPSRRAGHARSAVIDGMLPVRLLVALTATRMRVLVTGCRIRGDWAFVMLVHVQSLHRTSPGSRPHAQEV